MNGHFRTYALVAAAIVALGALMVVAYTGKTDAFGFALTIITILLSAAGLAGGQINLGTQVGSVGTQVDNVGSKVDNVHDKVDGLTSQLVDTTASDSFQKGQSAPSGSDIPPAPSSKS